MHLPSLPLTRDVVLVGGGHTHALVLRRWGMDPLPGVRLTLINPGPTAPYSGMLPGHVAGHYDRETLDIDLVRLARFAGARLILGAATALDPAARTITVPGRPPVAYDIASIDIGITSAMPALPGFSDHAVPAKPLGPFAARWQEFLAQDGPARVAVIGAGVAGVELAMAMTHALAQAGRDCAVTLVDKSGALSALGSRARRRLLAALADQGIALHEGVDIDRVTADGLVLGNGDTIAADFVTGAAGARPQSWLAASGIDTHDGFLAVGPTLQTSDPAVLAVGDCAHMVHAPRPKAGVYAVRQAPILHHNLRALAAGKRLRRYHPQKDYLKLISMGGKRAIGERFGLTMSGGIVWRWKDRIDQAFMDKFRDLPAMSAPPVPRDHALGVPESLGDKPMCGGCGAKVGRTALGDIASDFDDAATLGDGLVVSHDHLRSFWADPVVMTRIAVQHALGDIWAMGADPDAALATLILPRLSPDLQARMLAEIMQTARAGIEAAGGRVVGGHTSVGPEFTVGFSVTGRAAAPVGLDGARPGDALILTKPLGSGVLMAAEMAGKADGAWISAALDLMTQPQGDASRLLRGHARAMTDVTGFGLAGHLMNICAASGCAAVLDADALPLMPGAAILSRQGVRSTLYPDNRAVAPDLPDGDTTDLLFDPQTAGGLLASVPADKAPGLQQELVAKGYPAAIIGTMEAGAPRLRLGP